MRCSRRLTCVRFSADECAASRAQAETLDAAAAAQGQTISSALNLFELTHAHLNSNQERSAGLRPNRVSFTNTFRGRSPSPVQGSNPAALSNTTPFANTLASTSNRSTPIKTRDRTPPLWRARNETPPVRSYLVPASAASTPDAVQGGEQQVDLRLQIELGLGLDKVQRSEELLTVHDLRQGGDQEASAAASKPAPDTMRGNGAGQTDTNVDPVSLDSLLSPILSSRRTAAQEGAGETSTATAGGKLELEGENSAGPSVVVSPNADAAKRDVAAGYPLAALAHSSTGFPPLGKSGATRRGEDVQGRKQSLDSRWSGGGSFKGSYLEVRAQSGLSNSIVTSRSPSPLPGTPILVSTCLDDLYAVAAHRRALCL